MEDEQPTDRPFVVRLSFVGDRLTIGTIRSYFLTLADRYPEQCLPLVKANWSRIAYGLIGNFSSRACPTYEDAVEVRQEAKEKANQRRRR